MPNESAGPDQIGIWGDSILKSAHRRSKILAIALREPRRTSVYGMWDHPPELSQRPSAAPFFGVERGT
jgi:hypothetical protein